MRIITRKRLVDFWTVHPASEPAMRRWEFAAKAAVWTCPNDVKQTFNTADWANSLWIFDVGRNRIVADARYQFETPNAVTIPGTLYLKHVFTHAQYDAWSRAKTRTGGR
jgi:mRNA interferase HigB